MRARRVGAAATSTLCVFARTKARRASTAARRPATPATTPARRRTHRRRLGVVKSGLVGHSCRRRERRGRSSPQKRGLVQPFARLHAPNLRDAVGRVSSDRVPHRSLREGGCTHSHDACAIRRGHPLLVRGKRERHQAQPAARLLRQRHLREPRRLPAARQVGATAAANGVQQLRPAVSQLPHPQLSADGARGNVPAAGRHACARQAPRRVGHAQREQGHRCHRPGWTQKPRGLHAGAVKSGCVSAPERARRPGGQGGGSTHLLARHNDVFR